MPSTNTLYKEKNATTLSRLPYTFMRQEKRHEEARSPDNIYIADDKGSSEEEAAPALHPSSHLSFSYYFLFDRYIFSLHLLILWLSTSSSPIITPIIFLLLIRLLYILSSFIDPLAV